MKIVSDEVKRLSRLVRSMLDLSRIDSGELKMNTVRLDLTEAMGSVLVASEQRIEKKKLVVTGMEDCERQEIEGDRDLMKQVLYNLLDNAIKFTDEGGNIAIRIYRENGRVYTAIRNSGEGIPPEEMPQIFERFYKSDRSRSLDKNGVGLGLYIVHTVVRLHGGEVSVRSVQGEYTEFTFWIPEPKEKN
jgi:signal transduction histidine kinase